MGAAAVAAVSGGVEPVDSREPGSGSGAAPPNDIGVAPDLPADSPISSPPSFRRELFAVSALLLLVLALTVGAGPVSEFAAAAARQLSEPAAYIAAVLGGER
jgi:hypothetical protein